jgi:hypothetical protein
MPFTIFPHMLRHACGYALANAGHDTRALQAWLGHKNIQHTVRYTELAPETPIKLIAAYVVEKGKPLTSAIVVHSKVAALVQAVRVAARSVAVELFLPFHHIAAAAVFRDELVYLIAALARAFGAFDAQHVEFAFDVAEDEVSARHSWTKEWARRGRQRWRPRKWRSSNRSTYYCATPSRA